LERQALRDPGPALEGAAVGLGVEEAELKEWKIRRLWLDWATIQRRSRPRIRSGYGGNFVFVPTPVTEETGGEESGGGARSADGRCCLFAIRRLWKSIRRRCIRTDVARLERLREAATLPNNRDHRVFNTAIQKRILSGLLRHERLGPTIVENSIAELYLSGFNQHGDELSKSCYLSREISRSNADPGSDRGLWRRSYHTGVNRDSVLSIRSSSFLNAADMRG